MQSALISRMLAKETTKFPKWVRFTGLPKEFVIWLGLANAANDSYHFQLLRCRTSCTCKEVSWNFAKSVVGAFSVSCIIFT
jgi:hypothetical protein